MTLLQIKARHFTASVLIDSEGKVDSSDPKLAFMKGWGAADVKNYAMFKGWQTEIVVPHDTREYGKTEIHVPIPSRD